MGGPAPILFKPDDLVRTPSGRTCTVLKLNPDGSRRVEDRATGEVYDIMPAHLVLVRASTPKPWPKRTP